jgi:hypothetical protein
MTVASMLTFFLLGTGALAQTVSQQTDGQPTAAASATHTVSQQSDGQITVG